MQFAPLYPALHTVLKPLFPDCLWEGPPQTRKLALTFDDGPHPHYTPALLRVLDRYNIQANFFWLGVCVQRSPHLAQEIFQRGHWIGLHGYCHRSFPLLSRAELQQSLTATQSAIAQACQVPLSNICHGLKDVRPPNGFFTPQTLRHLQTWGYRPIMWSVVPEDWVRPGIATVLQRVLHQTHNGSIIVLHDGACGGQDVAAIATDLIPCLLDQGYEFVTIDDFWQNRPSTQSA